MSKAVMISIQPSWIQLISSGKKTVEVRKTRPKIETPFKCYIYCTKPKTINPNEYLLTRTYEGYTYHANGKVIGEFTCDRIYQYSTANVNGIDISDEDMEKMSCLTYMELEEYELSAEAKDFEVYKVGLYGWHISDLKIYDKPKELNEFKKHNRKCNYEHLGLATPKCSECNECQIGRAPQSWCYVEEIRIK